MKNWKRSINEVLGNLDDVELIWGVGRNESSHDGKIAICVVAGFKNKKKWDIRNTTVISRNTNTMR